MKKIVVSLSAVLLLNSLSAQKKAPENWYLLDPKADKVYGAGIEEAYKTLGDRKSETVIVAVIDSGVDVNHEDLKDVIWVNKDEIPNNGIDDDKNGYIDDINGWSFLGGAENDIDGAPLEIARIYQTLSKKYEGKTAADFTGKDKEDFAYWKTIEADYTKEMNKTRSGFEQMDMINSFIQNVKKDKGEFTKEALKDYEPKNDIEKQILPKFKLALLVTDASEIESQITGGLEHYEGFLKNNLMNGDSLRRAVVGDDPLNPNQKIYGCNRVQGPDAFHGTHVSGIIAANRTNSLGIIGEAANVQIMVLRAVPNGDERDKDIANAIYYAVDNGASIVNMSFGKGYSPHKDVVDRAMKYAQDHDVLLIHAAGNDSKNKEIHANYPNKYLENGLVLTNWIDVGASSYKKGKTLPASFSNYGTTKVDLFGPGVAIHSTVPDNKYKDANGTSMACPSVAGVAALIRSYFPELTAEQVKKVMEETVVKYNRKVQLPGGTIKETKKGPKHKKSKVRMTELCVTGGFVNANNAVKQLLKDEK